MGKEECHSEPARASFWACSAEDGAHLWYIHLGPWVCGVGGVGALLLTRMLGQSADRTVWIEVPTHAHGAGTSTCIPSLSHTNMRDRHTWSVFAVIRRE